MFRSVLISGWFGLFLFSIPEPAAVLSVAEEFFFWQLYFNFAVLVYFMWNF